MTAAARMPARRPSRPGRSRPVPSGPGPNRVRAGAPEPRTSAAAVRAATGRDRDAWFRLLDAWDATARLHKDIAAWLMDRHGVDHWWAQTLTVDYEQARGMRPPGGHRDGTYTVSASKTIAVPAARLFEAFVDAARRRRWLPTAVLRQRTAQPGRSVRFDCDEGATRLLVSFTAKGADRTQVAVAHERLTSADAAAKAKTYWRDRLDALKRLLEG